MTETETGAQIITRLQGFLPIDMRGNVLDPPNKPEQITADIVKQKYPGGLLIAGFLESAGEGLTETQIYAMDCIAASVARSDTLARFCKICVTGWKPDGGHRFEFHEDKLLAQEAGITVRRVTFRKNVPAARIAEPNVQAEVDKLNL